MYVGPYAVTAAPLHLPAWPGLREPPRLMGLRASGWLTVGARPSRGCMARMGRWDTSSTQVKWVLVGACRSFQSRAEQRAGVWEKQLEAGRLNCGAVLNVAKAETRILIHCCLNLSVEMCSCKLLDWEEHSGTQTNNHVIKFCSLEMIWCVVMTE